MGRENPVAPVVSNSLSLKVTSTAIIADFAEPCDSKTLDTRANITRVEETFPSANIEAKPDVDLNAGKCSIILSLRSGRFKLINHSAKGGAGQSAQSAAINRGNVVYDEIDGVNDLYTWVTLEKR